MFSIEAYNQLLHGIAIYGNWLQVHILLHSMKSQGISHNYQTYAALIEACWHQGEQEKLKSIVSEMEKEVNNLFERFNIYQYLLLTIFKFIKAVSDTVFDMINAAYHDMPLIFTRAIHLSLSRLFLILY